MKIEFADSFGKSIKRLIRHQTWWYKTYEFFRRDLPYFLENIWFFRKELYAFRSWDYSFNIEIFRRSLEKTVNTIEHYGHEVDISRMKKVEKMKRAIHLMNRFREDCYISDAEKKLGNLINNDWQFEKLINGNHKLIDSENEKEKNHNRKVYDLARKIEEDEWKELWYIFKGQDNEEYRSLYDSKTDKEKKERDIRYDWFDGSNMKGWWD